MFANVKATKHITPDARLPRSLHVCHAINTYQFWLHVSHADCLSAMLVARLPRMLHVCHIVCTSVMVVASMPCWLQISLAGCKYAMLAAGLPRWLHVWHAGCTSAMLAVHAYIQGDGCTSARLLNFSQVPRDSTCMSAILAARHPCSINVCHVVCMSVMLAASLTCCWLHT
jgi:hypothetical protein